jgi:(1->4)-alpha-D-glucan 1-alpha-D-glucosylmutase
VRADTDLVAPAPAGVAACIDQLARNGFAQRPGATYRLQFHHQFRFQDAFRLVPYLHELGITHLYASPVLKARAGSQHGYDITDHNQINPEIGTEGDLRALVAELRKHRMGLILDIVPNHMGVGFGENPWWQDVLANGRTAASAEFFDIDWQPLKSELRDKVLLPVLGSQYGEELEEGRLKLEFQTGEFWVKYYDKRFPIDPQTIPRIFIGLSSLPASLAEWLQRAGDLPRHWETDPARIMRRRRETPPMMERLRSLAVQPEVQRTIAIALGEINGTPGEPQSFDRLHQLLEIQPYRFALWRVSAEEINYRRFFDINDLVGLRMENPAVFAATHKLLRRLLADRLVDGFRIDHPDGMLNPRQYFARMQMLAAAAVCHGAEPEPPLAENGIEEDVQSAFTQNESAKARPPLYLVVEKILEPGEELPAEWAIDGTSGYEFANLVNQLLIAPQNEQVFAAIYARFTGEHAGFSHQLYIAKKNVMNTALAGELNVLAHLLDALSSTNRRARDFTRKALHDALRETIACFPVYRSYIDERGEITERDRRTIEQAIRRAKRLNSSLPAALFDFVQSNLLLEGAAAVRSQQLYFCLKFQQLTGPVMAKGLEDTVCYTYNRFIAVNEVGGSPGGFGISLDDFHRANAIRVRQWPNSLLATSTHDTKRSEDVRARLQVLSEMPAEWSRAVMRWRRSNERHKTTLPDGRVAPDPNEEYFLYQTLIGAWPVESGNGSIDDRFITRIEAYIEKALHEAKVNLSWINPDPEYVAAVKAFVRKTLSSGPRGRMSFFLKDVGQLLRTVRFFGGINSLSQTLLKTTSPGVPDIYQGNEFFDLSLVDPDNRRAVDFAARTQSLAEITSRSPAETLEITRGMLAEFPDHAVKLWVTMRALRFRREHHFIFRDGSYLPLHATGDRAPHVCAFARWHDGAWSVTAVPRFSYTLMRGRADFPLGDAWGDAELLLPPDAPVQFENVMTSEIVDVTPRRTLPCSALFATFPVALLAGR